MYAPIDANCLRIKTESLEGALRIDLREETLEKAKITHLPILFSSLLTQKFACMHKDLTRKNYEQSIKEKT